MTTYKFSAEFEVPMVGQKSTSDLNIEDGGRALICEVPTPDDETFFVRLQSWDDTKEHATFKKFAGRLVRVTVETVV